MHEEETNEYGLEGLLEILRKTPKDIPLVIDTQRHEEALRSVRQIVEYVRRESPDAKISLSYDEIIGTTLLFTIVVDMLNIYNVKEFFKMAEAANTMDIMPRVDAMVEIGFAYNYVRRIAPPTK